MDNLNHTTVCEFFEATKLAEDPRPIADFAFMAIRQADAFEICRGQLELRWGTPAKVPPFFKSERVVAGRFSLDELRLTPEQFVSAVLGGRVTTPVGQLTFPPDSGGRYSTHFQRFHPDRVNRQHREQRLIITGSHLKSEVWSPDLEWELKAAAAPFDTLADLAAEYAVGPVSGNQNVVEIVCLHSAVVARESTIDGEKATIAVILADGLDTRSFRLGYILFEKDVATRRATIEGGDFTWSMKDGVQRGEVNIAVPVGAVLHCYASYKRQVQHHYWLTDPKRSQNPYRAVYEAHDSNLQGLKRSLRSHKEKEKAGQISKRRRHTRCGF